MEEAKAMAQHQQQQEVQQQQQQQNQQQFILLQQQAQQQAAISGIPSNIDAHLRPPCNQQNSQQPQQQQQQKGMKLLNQMELQMAYEDAWWVCHPDCKHPFASVEDACERLLPYHVVTDYEAEEDDRILDSDTTGQMPSGSQQWDNNIAAKVAEFTGTLEKQVLAFNIITLKREEETREKAGREAHEARLQMAAMVHQAEQARAGSHACDETMA
ncbi:hypothetical protein Patl1_11694 [Pistacia atlantica]|uniref:Uncharacterized protein n=1 Tax=Pistacia atlantica TaxID=434234 RepID=A0ACC1A5J7_9ROSI|nr:hypothetical protein Patl1_11694 [Pistacia atlantica]